LTGERDPDFGGGEDFFVGDEDLFREGDPEDFDGGERDRRGESARGERRGEERRGEERRGEERRGEESLPRRGDLLLGERDFDFEERLFGDLDFLLGDFE